MSEFTEPFDPQTVAPLVPQTAHHNLLVALEWAEQGAFVFPCQSSGPSRKQPCRNVFWRSMSTDDPQAVIRLWTSHPTAVPGIDVGKSKLLVIDCDRKPADGLTWFLNEAAAHNDALSYPYADTPSGGRHFYFTNPTGRTNARGSLPSKQECGVDVRGVGGFVIAPGAQFTDGGSYSHTEIFNAVPPPAWLLNLLASKQKEAVSFVVPVQPHSDDRRQAYGHAGLDKLSRDLASTPRGDRNNEANRLAFKAGQLVGGQCLTEAEAYEMLSAAALSWGIHPKDKALGPKGTIARSIKAGIAAPRAPQDGPDVPIHVLLQSSDLPEKINTAISSELPPHLQQAPGLVGQIADYITKTALYPQPGLSLGAALAIVGTAAGRHIAGPHKCGTHLYVVALAPSGAGKNHPLSMIATILDAAGMRQHIGPSQFISMPAVINFLCRSPLSCCAMDEFGAFLKRINNRRASGFEGAISGLLRTAWGSSFSAMTTPEWAQRAAETIFSPALSIYGVSTAREFYDSLEGADVTNGVLNRFLIIETKIRPREQLPSTDPVPAKIVDQLAAIYNSSGPLSMLSQSAKAPAYTTLQISQEAEAIRKALVDDLHQRGDADHTLEPFLARTAENALRLASILTIGQGLDEIDADSMAWGRDFALWSSNQLADGAGLYIADSDTQAAANAVRRAIQDGGGRVGRRELVRAIAHKYKRRELDDVISSLAESETIIIEKIEPSEKGGRAAYFYRLNQH